MLDAMFAASLQAAPAEACGLLGGRDGVATSHYPVPNVAPESTERFVMDPAGQREAFTAMERRGEELVAIYHSHPSTGASPSKADLLSAHYLDAFYLIVGLRQGRPYLRAFRIHPRTRAAVEVRWLAVRPR